MRRRRGAAIVITLLSLALMMVFLTLVFGATEMSYRVSGSYAVRIAAGQAARAGLATALQTLDGNNTFQGSLSGSLPGAGASWTVTFQVPSGSTGVWSTNNVGGAGAVLGWDGRTVPAGCCYLVSVGQCGSVTAQAESMARLAGSGTPPIQILARWGD